MLSVRRAERSQASLFSSLLQSSVDWVLAGLLALLKVMLLLMLYYVQSFFEQQLK